MTMISIQKKLICVFILCMVIFSVRSETAVTSSGFLVVKTFSGGRAYLPECSTNLVSATLGIDGRWALEVRPIHQTNDMLYGKEDVIYLTYDGLDNFFCQYSEAFFGMKNGRPDIIGTKPLNEQPQLAYISKGVFPFSPFDAQKRTQILWLIYGAGIYVHESKAETMPLPWLAARYRLDAFGFRIDSELSTNFPYVPVSLRFTRDIKLDFSDEKSEFDRPEFESDLVDDRTRDFLRQRKALWQNGVVVGKLKTTAFTNISGLSLPLSSDFSQYFPSGDILRSYALIITNVVSRKYSSAPTEQTIFHPPVLADLAVTDSRFRFRDKTRIIDNITYSIKSNGGWISEDSDAFRKLVKLYLENPTFSAPHKLSDPVDMKRYYVIAALLIITILPLTLLSCRTFLKNVGKKSIK